MANIKSAMKRVKVNKVKAAANKARKSELKTVLKKANLAVESGANKEEAIKAAIKRVDQACARVCCTRTTQHARRHSWQRSSTADPWHLMRYPAQSN